MTSSVLSLRREFTTRALLGQGIRVEMARDLFNVRQRKDSGAWYVDCRPYGRIQWIMVEEVGKKPLDEQMAHMLLAWIRAEIAGGKSPKEAVDPYLPRPTALVRDRLPAWLEMMSDQVERGDRSPTYLRELVRYAKPSGHFSPLFEVSTYGISYGLIEDWTKILADRGLGQKTRTNVVGAFHSFLGWLVSREEISAVPKFPPQPKTVHRPHIIPPDVQDAILKEIPEQKRGAFITSVELLLRPGEVRALNVENYDRRTRVLCVAHAMKGPRRDAPRRETKEGDIRYREASDRLHAWIERYVPLLAVYEGERPLFANPDAKAALNPSKRWTHDPLRTNWNEAATRAGHPGVQLYEGTKHSTATALRRAGVPLDVIQAAAGHKDVRSTERYAQLADDVVADALRKRR